MVGERSPAGSRADDDDVKMILLRHGHLPTWNNDCRVIIYPLDGQYGASSGSNLVYFFDLDHVVAAFP
jgi:hypothetical protein